MHVDFVFAQVERRHPAASSVVPHVPAAVCIFFQHVSQVVPLVLHLTQDPVEQDSAVKVDPRRSRVIRIEIFIFSVN
jgi:hypothetical protein